MTCKNKIEKKKEVKRKIQNLNSGIKGYLCKWPMWFQSLLGWTSVKAKPKQCQPSPLFDPITQSRNASSPFSDSCLANDRLFISFMFYEYRVPSKLLSISLSK